MGPLPVGTKLREGRFATGKLLRQTRFGFIYLGSDATTRQPVTITELCLAGQTRDELKLRRGRYSAELGEQAQQAFLSEGYQLTRLNRDGVETVIATFAENDTVYRVTQFVRSMDLMAQIGFNENQIVSLAITIGETLEAIHAAGLLHGAITPASLVMSGDRRILSGFGAGLAKQPELATLLQSAGDEAAYISPETTLEPRSDVYSLAATIYHLLTGQAPTPARERGADAELMEISWLSPKVSQPVASAVMVGLSLKPEARPATVRELLDRLQSKTPVVVAKPISAEEHFALPEEFLPPEPVAPAPPPRPAAPRPRVVHSFGAGQKPRARVKLPEQDSEVVTLAFSLAGDELHSLGADKKMRSWLTATGTPLPTVDLQPPPVKRTRKQAPEELGDLHSAAISPAGDMVACGYDLGVVRIWDLPAGTVRHTLNRHAGRINDLEFSSDGQWLASGGHDSSTIIWATGDGDEQQTMTEEADGLRVLAFSHDDSFLATGGDSGAIRVWNALTSDLVWRQDEHEFWATALAFSPDGKLLASGSYDRTIRLWNVGTGERLHTLTGHEGCISALAFHPDGIMLASASLNGNIRLWHAPSGQMKHTLSGHDEAINSLAFSADGSMLASGGGREIRLWQGG